MPYLLARIQCHYGKVQQFSEVMRHLTPILERKGWRLHGAYANAIGRLNRCYDVWEVPDANGVGSILALASAEPEFREWAALLAECVVEEELEFMNELPYSPGRSARVA